MTPQAEIERLKERIAYLEGKIAGLTHIIKVYRSKQPDTVIIGTDPKNTA